MDGTQRLFHIRSQKTLENPPKLTIELNATDNDGCTYKSDFDWKGEGFEPAFEVFMLHYSIKTSSFPK